MRALWTRLTNLVNQKTESILVYHFDTGAIAPYG